MNRQILKLAIPSILANITVPIVGMVDVAVAGHLNGTEGLAAAAFIGAISVGTMLFDLLYWNFGFLRAGTGGMTAQALGRGDMAECANLLVRSVALALAIALGIWLIQWPFEKGAFLLVKCSPEVKALALRYFHIRIWAAPATLSLMCLRGWFIGMQDTVSSMATDLIVNSVNIVGSIVLALGIGSFAGFGFPGVALGTLLAQYSGLTFAVTRLIVKYRSKVFSDFNFEKCRESFRGSELRRFMTMNKDLFYRSLCFLAVYVGFTVISARYGDLMLASSAILMKLLMIFSFFVDGFAYAGEALTGRYIGEKSLADTRKAIRYVFYWSGGVVLLFTAVYGLGSEPLTRIMTSDPEVLDACGKFLPWLLLMPLIGCAAFTWDGIYVGATASVSLKYSMIWAAVSFFTVWIIGFFAFGLSTDGLDFAAGGNASVIADRAIHVLMAAYFAHLLARAAVLTLRYRKDIIQRWFEETRQN